MKKKIIIIFTTLFLFFSSTVGIFATTYYDARKEIPAWAYDVYTQCKLQSSSVNICEYYNLTYVKDSTGDVSTSDLSYSPYGHTLILYKGKTMLFQYKLPPGDTFYMNMLTTMIANGSSSTLKREFYVDNVLKYSLTDNSGYTLSPSTLYIDYYYTNNTSTTQNLKLYLTASSHRDLYFNLGMFGTTYMLSNIERAQLETGGTHLDNVDLSELIEITNISNEKLDEIIASNSITNDYLSSIEITNQKIVELLEGSVSTETTNNNANIANDNLSNSVTEFDNIEKSQVDNMTENLNNLPTLDFNAYNDFAPTVQFVSSTMQQIYDSNQYLRLLINACLLIGIALLLIGRGNRK